MTVQEHLTQPELVIPALANHQHMLLDLCLRFGSLLLEVGAETSRIEDSITRILHAYGTKEPSAFAIPTLVLITFKDQSGTIYTSSRRISVRGNNFHKLSMLNQLSRDLCAGEQRPLEYFRTELERITNTRNAGAPTVILASMLIAVAFAFLFQGRPADIFAAAVSAIAMRWLFVILERGQVNSIFIHLVTSFVAGLGVELLYLLGVGQNPDIATISVLMNLVPGVLITNSIRETITGDFNSGINKMIEAVLIAIVLAVGTGIAVLLVRS